MRFGSISNFLEFSGGSYGSVCSYIYNLGLYNQKEVLENPLLGNSNFIFFRMMELRSYNVERIYRESVKCTIGEDLGIDKDKFTKNIPAIKEMLSQIHTTGYFYLCTCNRRKDGEIWTPYLQIVEMLIRMGAKIGCVKYTGKLKPESLIKIVL